MRVDIAEDMINKHYNKSSIEAVAKALKRTDFLPDKRTIEKVFDYAPVRKKTIESIAEVLDIHLNSLLDFSAPVKKNLTEYLQKEKHKKNPKFVYSSSEATKIVEDFRNQSAEESPSSYVNYDDTYDRQNQDSGIPDIVLPTDEELADLGSEIIGRKWFSYHITRTSKGKEIPTQSTIEITEKGACFYNHQRKGLAYQGAIKFEGRKRFLLILDSQGLGLKERIVYRYNYTKLDHDGCPDEIQGAWFGIDFGEGITSSPSFLTTREIDRDTEAYNKLKVMRGYYLPSLNGLKKQAQNEPEISEEEMVEIITSHEYEALACKYIKQSADNATINLFSTFFPNEEIIFTAIRHRIDRLVDEKKYQDEKLKVNFFFLNKKNRETYSIRMALRDGPDYGPVITNNIRRVKRYITNRKYSQVAEIKFYAYSAWPSGHYIEIEGERLFFGIIWSSEAAVNGPFMHITNPESGMWKMAKKDIKAIKENEEGN